MARVHTLGNDYARIEGVTPLNVIVGRNGSGKSRFLRTLYGILAASQEHFVRYVSPERAGIFKREAGVDDAIRTQSNWLQDTRLKNQATNFKTASATLLRELQQKFLLRMETDHLLRLDVTRTFQTDQLSKINRMLSNIQVRQGSEFDFIAATGEVVRPEEISSGESEVISLASEVLHFFASIDAARTNVLLLDEPDVHLHPDLQARFAQFLIDELSLLPLDVADQTTICVATHSTPLVCGLAQFAGLSLGTIDFGRTIVQQRRFAEAAQKVAPFFGHPLSQSISNDVLLIIEGEDDEQIWQQAVRSSQGGIRVFPCVAKSVNQQYELERFAAKLLSSLYDAPVGYSLRDGDGKSGALQDIGPIRRCRLDCYEAENLLVTDDCLAFMQSDWQAFCAKATIWLRSHKTNRHAGMLRALITSGDRMRHRKIKGIRQIICDVAGVTKPWAVVVGQVIGTYVAPTGDTPPTNSLADFFGPKGTSLLLRSRL
jgi:energy-coupling factor transporter ATP-binding protein EcfA2